MWRAAASWTKNALVAALRATARVRQRLDVFEGEPQVNPALLTLPNTVLTPHRQRHDQDPHRHGGLAVDNLLALVRRPPAAHRAQPRSSRPPDASALCPAACLAPAGKRPDPCQHVGQCASQQAVRSVRTGRGQAQAHGAGRDRRNIQLLTLQGRPGQPHQRRLLAAVARLRV